MKELNALLSNENSLPLSEREKLIQMGYDPKYLIDLPNGRVTLDLDGIEMGALLRMLEERRLSRSKGNR